MPALPDGGDLFLRVLGGMGATSAGRSLDLGGPRQRAVLGLLLVARGVAVPAGRIVDEVWQDGAPGNPAAALQSYVSHLRRALEPASAARSRGSLLVSEGRGYAVRLSDDAVDAWRFEDLVREASALGEVPAAVGPLRTALELWRGTPYAEHAGQGWADAESARLDALRAVAVEQLAAARLATGETAVLVPELEALVADEPLREDRWRLLALALYRSGRQADALGALRRARTLLVDQLGVDPGPALQAVEAQILAQDPALSPRVPPPSTPSNGTRVTQAAPARPADQLVDRHRELAQLDQRLDDAFAGEGSIALVEGPAGIGKTRLLTEVRGNAEQRGARVLVGRGSLLEQEFAYGVVRQLLEPLLADVSVRASLLDGAAAGAKAVFDVGPDNAAPPGDSSFSVLHGLYWLTVRLTDDRPLVLAVDDLQWCDVGTLRFLAYLARRAQDLPLLVVATIRTGEPHAEQSLLADLAQDPATVAVHPGPLTAEGVADLVTQRLGPAEQPFVDACHRTTGGNPLLVRQLLRALESEGVRPDTSHADTVNAIGSRAISSIVMRRLDRLSADAGEVARTVAVLGDGCTLPLVATFAGLSETAAADAIAALSATEILRYDYPLGFVHPLVRDAAYRSLAPGQRELAHERAARLLNDQGAAAERVAAHLLQAPHRGEQWVVDAMREAARVAAERAAPGSAITYLRRALAEPPADRGPVLGELGIVEAVVDGAEAVDHLLEAYALLPAGPEAARVAAVAAQTLVFAAGPGVATEFASRAADALPPGMDDLRQGLEAIARIGGYIHGLPADRWQTRAVHVEGDGVGARMLASQLAWEKLIAGVDREGAVALARFAMDGGVLQANDPGLFWVIATFVLDAADIDLGSFWPDTLARAYTQGPLFTALSTHLWWGHAQSWAGELREAEHSLRTAIEQSNEWGAIGIASSYSEAYLIVVLVDRGDLRRARAFTDATEGRVRAGDGRRLYLDATATLLTAEGRYAEALAVLDESETLMGSVISPVWRPWRSLRAGALAGLGRVDEAIALVDDELALAESWGSPRLLGRILRVRGQLRGADGADDLRHAVDLLRTTPSRVQLSRALVSLAALVPDDEAVQLLTEAVAVAHGGGADGIAASAREGLRRLGAPEQTIAPIPLTTTQRHLADLVTAGVSVRAIADRLQVSPQLVEHLLAGISEGLK
ncbi:BTAD domain-containing putative transcriptional regulator [Cellulomonas sp. URHD0024]|uniref:BTAD domain-containing putative transcriptional regulator n=1 Tax=Cellulomonas sp. URHD0024 TaxID=1302620 RepID=UPI00040F99B2|nr:BTAD domain-containing putative transcriptional regulator [Cellulomonas sp. URHD0024]